MPSGNIVVASIIVNSNTAPLESFSHLGGIFSWISFQVPSASDSAAIASFCSIVGGALYMGIRQFSKAWIEYLKDRDQALSGTMTRKVEELTVRLDENKETIDRLRAGLTGARDEANHHAQAAQDLRKDLQNSNGLYLSLAAEMSRANATIQEQTRLIAEENAENVRLRQEIFVLSQSVTKLSGAVSSTAVSERLNSK